MAKNTELKNGQRKLIDIFERHTDGQQVPEKVLNMTNHQGNENQDHTDISSHTCQSGYYQKYKR